MNEIKVAKTSAVTTIDGIGAITMPADTGRETKKIIVALETGNKANLQLCKSIARIKTTESYKEVLNSDGENITPTFGDFAEKVLEMSKGSASGYASVGEVFASHLESGYKYGHFVLMLKMRKIVDENGEPLTGDAIIEMLEEHGATPELSTRKLDELIKNLLCETEPETGDDDGDGAGDDGDGETDDDKGVVSLTTCFKIIRASATSAGKYEELNKLIVELENALGV